MRCSEAGFTLVEVVVGAAIGVFLVWGLVVLADRWAFAISNLNARLNSQAAADRLVERLSVEAASAWTVWAPSAHEIDFFAEDGSHRPFTWSYAYDPTQKTVTRSTGEVLTGLDGFDAAAADVTDLANPSAVAYDPLLAGSHATSVAGNALVSLHLLANGVDRTELLASGTAPTTFTVVVRYTPSPAPVATPTPIPLR